MCCWPAQPRPTTPARSVLLTRLPHLGSTAFEPRRRLGDHGRRCEVGAVLGLGPVHGVGQHPPDVGVVVDRVLLITGREVEDLAPPPPPAAAGPEHLAAGEGGEEDQLVGGRDVEVLPVHLVLVDDDRVRYAAGDGMAGRHRPDQLGLGRVAPGQRAGGAHQPREDLGEVRGVQNEQAHPAEHPLLDAVDHRVVDVGVSRRDPTR